MGLPSFNIYIQRRYGYLIDTVLCSIFKLKESIFLRQVSIWMMRSNRVEITLINFEKSRSIVRIVDAINSKLHFSKEKIYNLYCSNQYALMMAERNVLWFIQKLQISEYKMIYQKHHDICIIWITNIKIFEKWTVHRNNRICIVIGDDKL